MYMLIAVNSSASRSFKTPRICAFPFMTISWTDGGKRLRRTPSLRHVSQPPMFKTPQCGAYR
jgi:hypothetical protein